jgi:hypothetical protein
LRARAEAFQQAKAEVKQADRLLLQRDAEVSVLKGTISAMEEYKDQLSSLVKNRGMIFFG